MAKKTFCVANTRWGYCMQPLLFNSIKAANEYGKQLIEEGCVFAYRLYDENGKQVQNR